MSTARLWAFLAMALPVLAALIAALPTVDLTYHLRAGAETLTTGAIPATDSWTFTVNGQPWTNQQWGAQLVLHAAELLGGWTGLAILRAALVGLITGILFAIARRSGQGVRTAALLALAAFAVASPAMALRPQLLGMAAFAVVLLALTTRRERPAIIWAIPVIVAVWANLHGSFFLGPLAVGLTWLQDVRGAEPRRHRLLLVAVLSIAAACLTPFGPAVWAYAISLSSNPDVTMRISEWQPTTLRTPTGLLFFSSVAAVAVLIARRGRVIDWPTLAWLGTFIALGLYTERGVAWWALAVVPVVAVLLPTTAPATADAPARPDPPLMRRTNVVLAGALCLAILALLPVWRPIDPGTRAPDGLLAFAPSRITAALRAAAEPGDHVLAEQAWTSWFEYAVPDARYAVDSRIELFPTEVWDAYDTILAGRDGWEEQLADWDVDIVVLAADHETAIDRLLAAGWRQLHVVDVEGRVLGRP